MYDNYPKNLSLRRNQVKYYDLYNRMEQRVNPIQQTELLIHTHTHTQ